MRYTSTGRLSAAACRLALALNPDAPLLLLDLDETLVHAAEAPLDRPADFRVGRYHVYVRPHTAAFLAAVAGAFRLAVWTSSTADYARGVLHRICTPEIPLLFVWARERCTRRLDVETREVVWVKDLGKVKRLGYPLERVLIVDDTPAKLARQYGNLVRVAPFHGKADDDELPALAAYLARIRDTPSFRALEKRGWRTRSPNEGPPDIP